ncbi:MAG TPA: hypothetical protein PKD64_01625 [Pirellulaceae bacterium]|nr:hypothetical protein [Pirellulaceae bacterium]HMO90869.1 hypothetical protein [Pirellulaceae bacterium]HMP68655.1 hypothetical protein [Pirellulaceae bacterium]
MPNSLSTDNADSPIASNRLVMWWADVFLLWAVLAALAWSFPPDVNEAHYLCKAKNFWDPNYCRGDLFAESVNAHWFFIFSFGWLTTIFSLETTAWIGRLACWLLLAGGWCSLAKSIGLRRWQSVGALSLFVVLNRNFHLAGEWVVGGVEAKTLAYGFVFFSLGALARSNRFGMWTHLGLATLLHPLIGIWSSLSIGLVIIAMSPRHSIPTFRLRSTIQDQRPARYWLNWLDFLGCLILSIIAIFPLMIMNNGDASSDLTEAYALQVFNRLPHHLYALSFQPIRFVGFGLLLVLFFLVAWDVARQPKLHLLLWYAIGALSISCAGLCLSFAAQNGTELATNLLRFYWFRLSDVALPLFVAISFGTFLENRFRASKSLVSAILVIIALFAIGQHAYKQWADPRPGADRQSLPSYPDSPERTIATQRNWKKMCLWIDRNLEQDAIFITPRRQQTFKWYAARAEVVGWKEAPQDAKSLLEWSNRMNELGEFNENSLGVFELLDEDIRRIGEKYGAKYLVAHQRSFDLCNQGEQPTNLSLIYPEHPGVRSTYVVLALD